MNRGLFITFEGVDGCGKTTQLNKIADYLTANGYEVIITREPGALETGTKIRNILLESKEPLSDYCEMFLFLADRSQHIDKLIKPAVESGKIVLCDRHTDSTIAYQGYGRRRDIKLLKELNDIAVRGFKPDLTLFYDISVDTSMERLGKNLDRLEAEGKEFQERVSQGYKALLSEEPNRIKCINANNSIDVVYKDTKNIIIELLNKNMR